jgi:hypothetical protein
MYNNQMNEPGSFVPELNPLETLLLRHPPWAAALREKERLLELVGLDEMIRRARLAKCRRKRGTEPWILAPRDRGVMIPGEVCMAFEALTDWWADHPFATGDVAFVCEEAETDTNTPFPFLPSPLNLVLPTVEDFGESLRASGLPTQFVEVDDMHIYPLFGVDDPSGGFRYQSRVYPPIDLQPDLGRAVSRLVADPNRMVATVCYMARKASNP